MPVTIPQVLDLLMALVLIMFVPIGFWRGALREWLALTGILFGWTLQGEWSGPDSWGGDLAALTGLDPNVAAFAVGAGFFLGVTLIVGYGAGVALPYRPDLSWPNRLLGAALGFGNGTLILSGALRIMDDRLFGRRDDSPLRLAGLSAFLIASVGWVELLLLGVLLCALLAGLLRQTLGRSPLLEEYAPAYEGPLDDGDEVVWASPPAEAWQGAPTAIGERRHHEQETAVFRTLAAPVGGAAEARPAATPPTTAPNGRAIAPPVIALARPAPPQGTATADADDERTVPPAPRPTPTAEGSAGTNGHGPSAAVAAPAGGPILSATCGVCGTAVAERARFCPACGHIIGAAERRSVARPV